MNQEIKQVKAAVTRQTNIINNLSQQLNSKLSLQPKTQQTTVRAAARRRRRQRQRVRRSGLMAPVNSPTDFTAPVNSFRNANSRNGFRSIAGPLMSGLNIRGLTEQGTSFLKCAFAPPDFASNDVMGVPDTYEGPSLTKKHKSVTAQTLSSGTDYYFLLLPTPGIAFWEAQVATGTSPIATTVWTGINYSDFTSMFGSAASAANLVTKFRYVSNHIEFIPTVNQMTWSGNIQAFKLPITVSIRQTGAAVATNLWTVSGLQGVNAANANQFTQPFNNGFYGGCYSSNCVFNFQTILEEVGALPTAFTASDFGQLNATNGIPGLDSEFESLCIKITGVSTTESLIIKTWACVEYLPLPGSSIYEFMSNSPRDPLALELYRKVIKNLPIGVSYMDNDTFWQKVLSIISRVSSVGSLIPGPWGGVARGTNLVSNSLLSLY